MFELIGELTTGIFISQLGIRFYPYLIPQKYVEYKLKA